MTTFQVGQRVQIEIKAKSAAVYDGKSGVVTHVVPAGAGAQTRYHVLVEFPGHTPVHTSFSARNLKAV